MPRTIREIRIEGNVAFVPLTKGHVAKIDAEDVPLVQRRNWRANVRARSVYANCSVGPAANRENVYLHRLVVQAPKGFEVDHINGDGLDNRKANLRIATRAQNGSNQRLSLKNTSGKKGVYWDKARNKFQASIKVRQKVVHLGRFDCIEAASAAYDSAAQKYFDDFARPNLPIDAEGKS